ncbi:hypothetical protein QFC20_007142 [Naganishia adeliensis]|uniref:Uncharacterized protein n=1 Tax=Naganishia adeliensis TaxID=92952 RepID=A0ACC2V2B0_9TREE|nr:hypothetical protein QFC20_007142 [Naganishia adeliensis]
MDDDRNHDKGAVPSSGKTVMSQSEQLPELEDVIPHTNDRPARDRQILEILSDPAETNATPELIDVSALQCRCTEMMERVESRIADMGDTVHAVSTVRTRAVEVDEFLQVLLRSFRKLQNRVQTLPGETSRAEIPEILNLTEFKRDLKMLLSELRKLVRDTGSSEMKSTYRPLQQECFSSVAQMYRILSLGTNESHAPVTQVVQRVGDVRSPNLKRLAWMRRNEKSAQAPTPMSQSRRYVPKLVRRERHRPEVTIISAADREMQNIDQVETDG